jgi:hypothetical protein
VAVPESQPEPTVELEPEPPAIVELPAPVVDATTPEPSREPPWIHDIVALWVREIRAFFATARRFVVSPRRFGDEWSSGEFIAMNPITFVLASATILLPIDYGAQKLLGWDKRPDVNFAIEIARAMRPFFFAILGGCATHVVLRLLGSRRRISTTIGIMIYSTVLAWLLWDVGLLSCFATGEGPRVPGVMALLALAWLALALAGAHRIRWWWCAAIATATAYPLIQLVNLVLDAAGLS